MCRGEIVEILDNKVLTKTTEEVHGSSGGHADVLV